MAKDMVTVCLPPTPPGEQWKAISAAMEPYDENIHYDEGEWNWWHVFSHSEQDMFRLAPGHENDPRLIWSPADRGGSPRLRPEGRADGGPRGILDFDTPREQARLRAEKQWREWHDLARRVPPAEEISRFFARVNADYSIQQACEDYHRQPFLQEITTASNIAPGTLPRIPYPDPVSVLSLGRDPYVRGETARAIPSNVLLTLEGEWIDVSRTPGHESDRLAAEHRYFLSASDYLDRLDPEAVMVRVRFHS